MVVTALNRCKSSEDKELRKRSAARSNAPRTVGDGNEDIASFVGRCCGVEEVRLMRFE